MKPELIFTYTAVIQLDDGTTKERRGGAHSISISTAALRAQLDEAALWSPQGIHGEVRITEIKEAA
jgi:hypothetical protein